MYNKNRPKNTTAIAVIVIPIPKESLTLKLSIFSLESNVKLFVLGVTFFNCAQSFLRHQSLYRS